MLRWRLPVLLLALLAMVLLAPGCGSSGENGDSGDRADDGPTKVEQSELPHGSIAVELGEFFVRPGLETADAGEVTFHVDNVGSAAHELVVYESSEPARSLPQQDGVATLDEAAVIGRTDEVPPGESTELVVDLAPGRYLLLCNLPGHYASGQVVEFEVI